MKRLKIGIFGAYRGEAMIRACKQSNLAEVVAICDKWDDAIEKQKKANEGLDITYYKTFDEFIKHDMDAVVLANYANEHAPFAIRCMEAGMHVYSEVLPAQNMDEAVRLVECVEKTGKIYAYGENYCFMSGVYEMRRLYQKGELGEFEYGEGEYIHDCGDIWPEITYGDPDHWRNNMYSTFYCTHSLGPIIHATGLRPVSVVGIESPLIYGAVQSGSRSSLFGMEMVTLENDGIIKSIHGGLYKRSVWYSIYGRKGRAETAREDACGDKFNRVYTNIDPYRGGGAEAVLSTYLPKVPDEARGFSHGGSDYIAIDNFFRRLSGDKTADIIDVYEALDMWMPGLFAHFSILDDNRRKEIPNLRNPEEREKWRGDKRCTDKKVAGDQLLPTFSKGTPYIEPEVYERIRALWQKKLEEADV
ncbi:MAG: Gfo/Idh/MocA family oxidoreductase [Ruminococcaceae bacterium]|nr:Gfo/Idh/MocA family oxidoreductase [Oscillospiraceae bacterium]